MVPWNPLVGECFSIPDTMPVPAQALGVRSQGHPVSCPEPGLCKGKDNGTIKVQRGIHECVKQRKCILKTSFLTCAKAWTGKCLPKKKKKQKDTSNKNYVFEKNFHVLWKESSKAGFKSMPIRMINDVPSLTLGFLNQVKRRWYYLLLGLSFVLIKMWHSFLASVSPDENGSSGFSLQDCCEHRTRCTARSWHTVKDSSVEGDFSVSPVAGNALSSNKSSSTGRSNVSFLSFFL